MNDVGQTVAAGIAAVIGLAVLAVVVSQGANTVGVLQAFFGGLSNMIGVAISPVTGQSVSGLGAGGASGGAWSGGGGGGGGPMSQFAAGTGGLGISTGGFDLGIGGSFLSGLFGGGGGGGGMLGGLLGGGGGGGGGMLGGLLGGSGGGIDAGSFTSIAGDAALAFI